MAQEHDHFFRHVFGDPENAAGELRAVLPAEISALVDWSTLRLEESADIDTELREKRTDLLFSVQLAGEDAYLLALIEHKSQTEPLVALDLLGYMLRIWERCRRSLGDAVRLPPILPVVVCHDERQWRVPRSFGELYAIDYDTRPMLQPYLLDFEYALDDLTVVSEAELRARAMTTAAKVALFCLKRARVAEDMVTELEGWLDALRDIEAAPQRPGSHRQRANLRIASQQNAARANPSRRTGARRKE